MLYQIDTSNMNLIQPVVADKHNEQNTVPQKHNHMTSQGINCYAFQV